MNATLDVIITGSDLFAGLSEEALHALRSAIVIRRVEPRQKIYQTGEDAGSVYGVIRGYVILEVTDQWKEHVCIGAPRSGEWFGDADICGPAQRPCDAWALRETEAAMVSRRDMLALAEREPRLTRNILDRTAVRMHCAREVLYETAFLSIDVRIARHLVRMGEMQRARTGAEQARFEFSQEEFALIVGTTRKSVNKFLSEWRQNGWIGVQHREICLVDIEAIRKIAFDGESDPIGELWRQFLRPAASPERM